MFSKTLIITLLQKYSEVLSLKQAGYICRLLCKKFYANIGIFFGSKKPKLINYYVEQGEIVYFTVKQYKTYVYLDLCN